MSIYKLNIEGNAHQFEISGDFFQGEDELLIHNPSVLPNPISEMGYGVFNLLRNDEFNALKTAVQKALNKVVNNALGLNNEDEFDIFSNYHLLVSDDDKHNSVISFTRNFQNSDFEFDLDTFTQRTSAALGLSLSSNNPELGKSHVQLRISRPGSLDINPPHRDAYLSYYKNVINLWIPIFGCNSESTLPVLPKSHLINEREILKTNDRSATINGNTYVVPCVKFADGTYMNMIRPQIPLGGALVFTPYLIHGAAFNGSVQTRFSLELRLAIK